MKLTGPGLEGADLDSNSTTDGAQPLVVHVIRNPPLLWRYTHLGVGSLSSKYLKGHTTYVIHIEPQEI